MSFLRIRDIEKKNKENGTLLCFTTFRAMEEIL